MFCEWYALIEWNLGEPTEHKATTNAEDALVEADEWRRELTFTVARDTTGDVYPTRIAIVLRDFHTEEII
jgi:hypothetical protein